MIRPLGLAADALDRLGLGPPAFGLYQRLRAIFAAPAPGLPPAYLRVLTAGTANPLIYVGVGIDAAVEVVALARRHGAPLDAADAVLDFGCGCGRVAGPLAALAPTQLHGCDVNGALIDWCRSRLPGVYAVTNVSPPLPYPEGRFALVYALSVFTHLHEANAQAWLAELARVTRPGGLAVLSLFDEEMPTATAFRADLLAKGYLVRREGAEGSNLLCGYFSRAGFAERARPGWRALEFVGADASATGQTMAVLRRT